MNNINIEYFPTDYGELILGSYNDMLCLCDWRYRKMRGSIDKRIKLGLNTDYIENGSEIIDKAKSQLNEYFKSDRTTFDVQLLFIGTKFQKKVWSALMEVDYGSTSTYMGLAGKVQGTEATRAVASANGANAIAIIVPCHRIIGSTGEMIGYAGGTNTKLKLLQLENAFRSNQLSAF